MDTVSNLKETWNVTRFVFGARGLLNGLFIYTYILFLYDHFGNFSSANALKMAVILIIVANVSVLLLEVPTGIIGDHLGRKQAVLLSFIFWGIANFFRVLLYFNETLRGSLLWGSFAAITYAIGYTFFSGSLVAWVVDTLRTHNLKEGHGGILARGQSYKFAFQIIGAAVGLWLYLSGYIVYAFTTGCTIALVAAIYCWTTMEETQSMQFYRGNLFIKESLKRMKEILITGVTISIKSPAIAFIITLYTSYMFLNNVVNYLWPISMKSNFGVGKMTAMWYFIVFLGLALSIFGSKLLDNLHKRATTNSRGKISNPRLWTYLFFVVLLVSLAVITLGILNSYGFMPLALFVGVICIARFSFGFFTPAYNTLINNYIPESNSRERATIMSWASMLESLLTALLMIPASGSSGKSTTVGWIIPSSILFVVAIIVFVLMRRYQRKIGELPIKGDEAIA